MTQQQSYAKDQIDGFNFLRFEMNAELQTIHAGIGRVKEKVSANLKSEENPTGLLTHNERAYIECLELKKCEFEVLLQQDLAYWTENFDKARQFDGDIRNRVE